MDRHSLLTYCIGDVNIGIVPHCNQKIYSDRVLETFRTDDKPDVQVHIVVSEEMPAIDGAKKLYDTGSWIYIYDYNDDLIVGFRNHDDIVPYRMISFKKKQPSATLYLCPERVQADGFIYPLERSVAEILMRHFLYSKNGIMFHSCGVDDRGSGYLFIGPSTTGKSTLARIWYEIAGTPILSDEKVIVRRFKEEFRMYGTPWMSDAGMYHAGTCRLEKIFFIEHAPENIITNVQGIKAVIPMLLQAFPQFWDKRLTQYMLAFLVKLASNIPCYRLGFVPDSHVIDFVRSIS